MRILVFHGYLLRGTGSNVYNARLAAALARSGATVDLLCQERRPRELDFVDAIGTWVDGEPRVEVVREPVRVTAWRPDIGTLLPTYIADRYEGVEAKAFRDCTDEEVARYVERNVAAVRDVVARARPDVALANHLVMGPLVLARGLDEDVPYAVKVHGSALEYTVKRDPERFMPAAREGLARARTVLVGSRHTAESLWAALGDEELPARTRLGPPGVDIEEFRPRPRAEAAAEVRSLATRLAAATTVAEDHAFARDEAAAGRALALLDLASGRDRHVAFVGKLIVSKGIDLLAAAWPLVLGEVPDARLVIVGFGGWRAALERLLAALAIGDLGGVRAIAAEGRAPEGGPRAPLRHLLAFLDSLEGDVALRLRRRRSGARRAGRPDRTPGARRARPAARRLRGAGRAEHVPRGVRDGRRRGGRSGRAADLGGALRAGGGDGDAGRRGAGGGATVAVVRGRRRGGPRPRRADRRVAAGQGGPARGDPRRARRHGP
jgi:glycosyltransferase involved in cell wall biosynthesis